MSKKLKTSLIFISIITVISLVIGYFAIFFNAPQTEYPGERIYKGLYYAKEQVENEDGDNVNTFILTITKNLRIETGVPEDKLPLQPGLVQETSLQAEAAAENGKNVLAAINADFFYMGEDDKIQPCSVTIKDGELLTNFDKTRHDRGCFFGIKKDGTAVLGDENTYNEIKDELYQAVGAGPDLIIDGYTTYYDDKERHPRTAVGILEDGSVIFVVADGRTKKSVGFTIGELAKYMHSLGAVKAVNLDGGGSTTLVLKDPQSDIFFIENEPSDKIERPVANTLLVVGK